MPFLFAVGVVVVALAIDLALRKWSLRHSLLDGIGVAIVLTMIPFGEELAIPFPGKVVLIALGAGVVTWVAERHNALPRSPQANP
jgi:hypothetical protein